MIKYDLKCRECSHQFEGWFPDSAGFDRQVAASEVLCPVCSCPDVTKAIMAPNISTGRPSRSDIPADQIRAEARKMLSEMRKQVESSCDYVGGEFPAEARKIHYGETEERGIYGEATPEETRELLDDGIEVAPIPWIPSTDA